MAKKAMVGTHEAKGKKKGGQYPRGLAMAFDRSSLQREESFLKPIVVFLRTPSLIPCLSGVVLPSERPLEWPPV